ncbi:MAG: transglycosylase SLT domain-containing protein [Acidobacteria bacterium]|nr:transglycosylase SLT domain-containing protein [Acidobacteriota bacterium]
MGTPKKNDSPAWNLNRRMASAGCLFALVLCPALIGGEIISFTGPDGRRIFSNTGNSFVSPVGPSPALEPGTRLRIRRKGRPPAGIARLIDRISRKHGMDPELVRAVARVESNYNPTAISPKGARGVMQLLPETAERFGVADAYDPAQNMI